MRFITHEVEHYLSGSDAVVKRLSEILFIQVARAYLQEAGDGARFLAALKDPAISRVLAAMHAQPGRAWTVESLAEVAGASRARFAVHFLQLVGKPPIAYLTQWRMLKAAQMLRDSDRPVKAVALELGYQSEQSFARAFAAQMRAIPQDYRARFRGASRHAN